MFKIVVIGDKATGKSSIVNRFYKDMFNEKVNTTIGAAFAARDVRLADGTLVKLQIWDTAGEEMYRAMTKSFFREAAAGVIVFDVTQPASFDHATSIWLADFRDACPDSLEVLVANKMDVPDALKKVSGADGAAKASANSIMGGFYEVSAKSGDGVHDLFLNLAEDLVQKKKNGRF